MTDPRTTITPTPSRSATARRIAEGLGLTFANVVPTPESVATRREMVRSMAENMGVPIIDVTTPRSAAALRAAESLGLPVVDVATASVR